MVTWILGHLGLRCHMHFKYFLNSRIQISHLSLFIDWDKNMFVQKIIKEDIFNGPLKSTNIFKHLLIYSKWKSQQSNFVDVEKSTKYLM